MELHVYYNLPLVGLSILIACLAAFTSLEISRKVTLKTGIRSKLWLIAGSVIMGFGIWSTHFVGMLAVYVNMHMNYEAVPMVSSLGAAISGSFAALYIVSRRILTLNRLITGSVFMGAGISLMHYMGMSAISRVMIMYNPFLFCFSILIAIAASFVSLKVFFGLAVKKPTEHLTFQKIISSVFMGAAVSGMHYTGMMAASFYADTRRPSSDMEIHSFHLSVFITLIIFCFQMLLFFSSHFDRQFFRHDERMKDHEQRFQSLIKHNIDPIFILSPSGKILYSNEAGAEMIHSFGLDSQNWRRHISSPLKTYFKQVKKEQQALHFDADLKTDIGLFYINVTFIPVLVDNGLDSVYVICKDMTKQRQAEKEIHRMAHYDSLTDLPNRRHAVQRLTEVLEKKHSHGHLTVVFFLDLNRFKVINDALGHNVGDRLLQSAAERLSSIIPDNGFIARLGGDEFIIILTDARSEDDDIDDLAKQIIMQFEKPFIVQEHELITSVSIGIAVSPKDGSDGMELMKKADMAMYASKDRNKSKYKYYSAQIGEKEAKKLRIEMELREAIEKKRFVLHYQPQYSSADQLITGVEALLRVAGADGKLQNPGDFIQAAEETGLIIDLGKWIITEACRQAKEWHEKGYHLPVAINISAKQFQSEELVPFIQKTLTHYKLPPALLEAEVTESMTMEDREHSKKVLTALTELGISVSIDDFGTGHSSLSYLKDFPIHRLKIDKSFIDDLQLHPKSAQITGAIIAMGHQLSLLVVAEGVETAMQKKLLDEKGCDFLQGFYFSRPLPPEEIEELLHEAPRHP
ncbi:EAL domain-containing protein [Bacillus amyloliquefaciens]|uniref:bifunctional diguanylate cyclase/phosphodiesterase n=1 Tax=Bacillus TaxID=1386 RepID=UPI001C691473|nr:EAL domain-containing protein [Bacillus amyloliquefaciens]MBW8278388.1 EAL domain-containing protein [Bacillus amyloliquefaciens]MED0752129.1 EAL domain-containing protein [Bacillus amyloliquefaciens]WJM56879.1 EAL domain-containing protein [Bacillus amyloliquefaciens]